MNIFLDTTVLYKDPFWKGNFYKELLQIVHEKNINLFISSVVLSELERNFQKILVDENSKIAKLNEKISHYNFATSIMPIIDKEKSIDTLSKFYKHLKSNDAIQILKLENNIFPEIVNRAVWRKKPFTESKTELKDAITWLTYAKYAEKHNLENCILLTENVSDFCDPEKSKQSIFEIHHELQNDSKRFKVYLSPKSLLQSNKKTFQTANTRFNKWVEDLNIDERFLIKLIEKDFRKLVTSKIERKYELYELHSFFQSDYYLTGYITFDSFEFLEIDNINIDVFKNECIISGDLNVNCTLEGYEYNASRDSGEDSHRFYDSTDINVSATFSFTYDQNEIATNFNIDDLRLL